MRSIFFKLFNFQIGKSSNPDLIYEFFRQKQLIFFFL